MRREYIPTLTGKTVIGVTGFDTEDIQGSIDPFVGLYLSPRNRANGDEARFIDLSIEQAIDLADALSAAIRKATS